MNYSPKVLKMKVLVEEDIQYLEVYQQLTEELQIELLMFFIIV